MAVTTRSEHSQQEVHLQPSNRLVVCFDGTGNVFQGTPGDTNIVKLYNMLDRNNNNQMHYYQPGIGTYPAEGPVNVNWFRALMRKFETVIDKAVATSFDTHVIAGYKFIMRNYRPGTKIYVFGFSRGAYTARFLSRMISHVGLLSIGNEELVPFAYKVYQEYEQSRSSNTPEEEKHTKFMNSFKKHFCRTELNAAKDANVEISANESGIKVHFLGLFDCVNSVGNLDIPLLSKTPALPAVRGTAEHIRHAVAIDERRVKFKAALFSQEQNSAPEDIKEVWFPGNHGDIGGGWDVDQKEDGTARETTKDDYFQLSDIALKWMVDEIDDVERTRSETDRIAWNNDEKASFLQRFQSHKDEMITAKMHDTMVFKGGSSMFSIFLWNIMEYLPWIIRRWEYEHVKIAPNTKAWRWSYIGWPANCGSRRDIPSTALFHHSVLSRMLLDDVPGPSKMKRYVPTNAMWVRDESAQSIKPNSNGVVTAGASSDSPEAKRNLMELANQYAQPSSASEDNDRQPLRERPLRFVHDADLTVGSVPIAGKQVVVGPQKWDRIYHAALGSD